eukprot:scaffold71398_cov35-Prasinocladus_malaysianus.AAC.1
MPFSLPRNSAEASTRASPARPGTPTAEAAAAAAATGSVTWTAGPSPAGFPAPMASRLALAGS